MVRWSSVVVVVLGACAVDNPVFGLTESGTQGAEGGASTASWPSSGAGVPDTTGGAGGSSSNTTIDVDDSDSDSGSTMGPGESGDPDECEGFQHFILSLGGAPQTPQPARLDDGMRIVFTTDGTVTVAHFPMVVEPFIDTLPAFQAAALLAGGAGDDLAIAFDRMQTRVALGNGAYNFASPLSLPGTQVPHGTLVNVAGSWVIPSLASGVLTLSWIPDGTTVVTEEVLGSTVWVDGDGAGPGAAFVYGSEAAQATCRIAPFFPATGVGSDSAAASLECRTPSIAFDPMLGGLVVYGRQAPGSEIRAIRVDPQANPVPDSDGHFLVIASKGVDHPEVVRLPQSGDYWVVFDQGPQLTAMVLDGETPMNAVGVPKSFGGQADGRLQAFVIDGHPAVAFYTDDPAYGAGVHVVVDCDTQ